MHPARRLRWLRNGMLVMALVAWALCGLVTRNARHDIATATGDGTQAIAQINAASTALDQSAAAATGFKNDGLALIGTGSTYSYYLTAANQELTIAVTDNVAGPQAAGRLEFDELQVNTYNDQVQQAITDIVGNSGDMLAKVEIGYAATIEGGIQSDLIPPKGGRGTIRQAEQAAVAADLNSQWLGPGDVWWLLLAPFLVMLLLAAATSYVLWHGFRRLLSGRLIAAVAATLGLIILIASLDVHDGGQAKTFVATSAAKLPVPAATDVSFADSWPALTAWVVLTVAVLVLVYTAYRLRLDEYRYQP